MIKHPGSAQWLKWAKVARVGALGVFCICLFLLWKTGLAPIAPEAEPDGESSDKRISTHSLKDRTLGGHIVVPGGTKTVTERPDILQLLASLESGQAISLSVGEGNTETSWRMVCRPRALFAEGFQTTLGTGDSGLGAGMRSYEGRVVGDGSNAVLEPATATVVVVGNSIAAVIKEEDGAITYVRTNSVSGVLESRTQEAGTVELACREQAGGIFSMETENGLVLDEDALWANAQMAQLRADEVSDVEIAELTGIDPVTGHLDKYVNRIPEAPAYAASLKDALLLLVLDKEATGPDDPDSLASRASIYLATISNIAAVYENQLGVRLLVSELIMTPDSDEYVDLPATSELSDFRSWVSRNRRRTTYGWTLASKFGDGLTGRVLGVAFVGSLNSNNGVSICDTSGIWDVLAHEMGHNFGSEHSSGGIMNSNSLGGRNRSFFADVQDGETSAEAIFQHASANNRLLGNVPLRDAEQIPFGDNDSATTSPGAPVLISPLSNDETSVRNGEENTLTLEEVGSVSPFTAGEVEIVGNDVRFTPAANFQGTAWFSYSLRGSVGNSGAGWLHKADVGVRVGTDPTPRRITMPPGGSYSFRHSSGTNNAAITQPAQAQIDVSRDDSRLIIIRADQNASGSDSFRISNGNATYTIVYDEALLRTQPDRFTFDPLTDRLEFYPLINDEGAGERWLQEIHPVYGVGTAGASITGNNLFATSFRLLSAELTTPELGSIDLPTDPVVINGRRTFVPRGSIVFLPSEGAAGTARIEYRVQDASGRQATEIAEISMAPVRSEVLIAEGAAATILVPQDDAFDDSWMQRDFDDSGWRNDISGIGYERNSGYENLINANVEDDLFSKGTSAYLRIPFEVDDPLRFSLLTLKVRYDDGFVAYLNGVEVARANAQGVAPLAWNAAASRSHSDSEAAEFTAFDISDRLGELDAGMNVLAIHGLNQDLTSSDFLIVPELEGSIVGEGADIIRPGFSEVSISEDTGLLASGRILGSANGQVTGQWSVEDAPIGAVVDFGAGGAARDDVEIQFSMAGEYTLRFFAPELAGGEQSDDSLRVIVGQDDGGLPRGASIAVSEIEGGASLRARLMATIDPPASDLTWQMVSGPGTTVIDRPDQAETEVLVANPGDYVFRIVAESGHIHSFQDVSWNAGDVPSTLVSSPVVTGDGSAVISGYVAGVPLASEITFFIGTKDGGEVRGQWEMGVPSIADETGRVEVTADGLLPNGDYFFRFAVASEEGTIWSDAGRFTTAPIDTVTQILLAENAVGTVYVPLSATDAESVSGWQQLSFDDDGWFSGNTGFGYDTSGTFSDFVTTDILNLVQNSNTTLYVRIPFHTEIDPRSVEQLTLRMRYDDAFIAYLNGVEVARSGNAPPGDPAWNAVAPQRRDNSLAIQFEDFEITDNLANLREGENVLAILGVNLQLDSRDLLISPEIVATTRPNNYSRWAEGFKFADGLFGMMDDPDSDGISNFYEFVFALDPDRKDKPENVFPSVVQVDDVIKVEFLRRRDAAVAGIDYVLEHSVDLDEWGSIDTVLAEPILSSDPSLMERVRIELPRDETGYVRLQVILEP